MEEEKVKCLRCGSEQITWSYGSRNYCLRCGFGWDPEKLWKIRENAKKRGLSGDETEKEVEKEVEAEIKLRENPGCFLEPLIRILMWIIIICGGFAILFAW